MGDFVSHHFTKSYNSLVDLIKEIKHHKDLKSFYLRVKKELIGIQHLVHHAFDLENALIKSEESETRHIDLYMDHISKLIWLLRKKQVSSDEILDYLHWDIMDIYNHEVDGAKPKRNSNPVIPSFKLNIIVENNDLGNEQLNEYLKKWLMIRQWVEQEKSKHFKAWEKFETSMKKHGLNLRDTKR